MQGSSHDDEQILDEQDSLNKKENEPTAITYGDVSVSMKCPHCLQQIRSEIMMKPEFISLALGLSIFAIVPNFIMMLLVIALMQFTASKKHRCPLCQRQLGSDGIFLLYFTDEVMSFSLFSAGFIFTKKMLMTACLIAFAAFLLTVRVAFTKSQNTLATTWPQYAEQCGRGNPSYCLNKYKDKNFINWEGYVMRMVDNRQSRTTWYLHAISLFMKMNPPLAEESKPDILLTLNSDAVFFNSDMLKGVVHGDLIKFNCSLHERERGSLKDVMHFHVEQFKIQGHDTKYSMFTTEFQQEWIQIHVENKGKLQSEMDEPHNIKPI